MTAQRPPLQPSRIHWWLPVVYAGAASAWIALSGAAVARLASSADTLARLERLKGFGFVLVTTVLMHLALRVVVGRVAYWAGRVDAAARRDRALVEASPDAILVVVEGRVVFANAAAVRLAGAGALEGRSVFEWFAGERREAVEQLLRQARAGTPVFGRQSLSAAGGRAAVVDVGCSALQWDGGYAVQLALRDVTVAAQLEEQAARLTRALRVLSAGNEIVARAVDPAVMMREVCRVAVEEGHLRLVWVGLLDPDGAPPLRMVAYHGREGDEAFAAALARFVETSAEVDNPAAQALHSRHPCVIEDVSADPRFPAWRDRVRTRGFASVASLPLVAGGRTLGVLNLGADTPGFMGPQVVETLGHLADSLAFGLAALRSGARARAAERSLGDTQAQLHDILEFAPNAVFVKDLQGRYLLLNRACEQLWKPRAEVLGQTDRALFPGPLADQLLEEDRRVLTAGECLVAESTRFDPPVTLLTSKFPLRDHDGRIVGLCGIATDVTEARRTERALRASEARANAHAATLKATFDAIDAGVVVYDGAGVATAANARALKQLGFDPRGLDVATVTRRLQLAPGSPTPEWATKAVLAGEAIAPFELRREVPGQPARTVLVSVQALARSGSGPRGVVLAARDITERARHVEALRALADRLSRAREAEATRIARDLHDDLGQSLTALRLVLGTLEHLLEAREDAPGRAALELAVDASAQSEAMLARLQSIVAELRPASLGRLGLAAALRSEAQAFARRSGLACDLSVDDAATADEPSSTALFRVAQEALTNVARHARASRVTVGLQEQSGRVVLEVTDDGVGFAPEAVSASLGLLGMRERLVAVRGALEVVSRPGAGATVRGSVPARGAAR